MKLKKLISTLLVAAMVIATLVGCAPAKQTDSTPTPPAASTTDPTDSTPSSGKAFDKLLTIENYNVAANYQGVQSGWFAKVLKDNLNIELNIIAPQVAGGAIYQTRTSSGNLGDIVLLERSDFADCVATGLIKDITNEIYNCPNLMVFKDQIEAYNKTIPGNDGKIYGIPVEMTNTSPMSYSQDVIYSSPMLRWDLYSELGCPEIEDLDGLLDVLAAMKENHPTNENGDPAYPFSLWPDWDGGDGMMGIANVVQLTTWYGEKIKQSVILKPDNTFTPVTDKNASYYKILHFLNKAQRRGLVDPDSGTQDWDTACAKMSNGQVYLFWYSWQVGFWNSTERLKNGNAFIFVPVKDQLYYADSDSYYGSGRIIGVGSSVDAEKYERIMAFLDWYASPDACEYQHNGIEGFTYEIGADGRYYVKYDNALMDNLPVPEEWGGGGYNDGFNKFNQWIVAAISTNPKTGEPYSTQYWSTYKESMMTQMKKEWAERFGAAEPVDYMKKNNVLLVSPNVSITLPGDTPDISVIRNQCMEVLNDYSWRMIFAKDDAEFNAMWDQMSKEMDGLGFQQLVEFDKEVYSIELQAKKEAAESAR
ncbi:MAG: sugar ABC transporter substrate-binding protein [Clostridiaceae bacterium]|mgnify:CR=1 FL=1|nr:sugar ABC transporter substrate-binding protein [Clostridiaceae bacterium]